MAFSALCLMVIQRFLPCLKYGPVMDDWFNYGDLYEKTWSQYVIPTQKLAIRPMAGLFDIFVTAPAFGHLWIIKLLMCLMLFAAVFMLYKVLSASAEHRSDILDSRRFQNCMRTVFYFPVAGIDYQARGNLAERVSYLLCGNGTLRRRLLRAGYIAVFVS